MTTVHVERGVIDGQERVLIDGRPAESFADESLDSAALRHITDMAKHAPGEKIRAVLHGPKVVHTILVDGSGGTVIESSEPATITATEKEPGAAQQESGEPRVDPTAARGTKVRRPARSEANSRENSAPSSGRNRLAIGSVIGAGVLVAGALGVSLFSLLGGGDTDDIQMQKTGAKFTAAAPLEWAGQDPSWRSPALASDAGRALVVGGDKIAMLTDDPRAVVLVNASDGSTLWSAKAPGDKLSSGLAATRIDDQIVVVAQAGSTLHWWDITDGTHHELGLPDGATLSTSGTQPVIRAKGAATASIIQDGKLHDVPVPAEATILAAHQDDSITAVAPRGWWRIQGGDVGEPRAWPYGSTKAITPTPAAIMGGKIVTVLNPTAPGQPARVVIYDDGTEKVSWLFQAPINPPVDPEPRFVPSTSRTWGIFGRSLIDTKAGAVTDLGAWRTVSVLSDRACGRIGDQHVIVGPKIPRGLMQQVPTATGPQMEGCPSDLTKAGALVQATDGDTNHLYLLPNKPQ